jgi:hypothetical protein
MNRASPQGRMELCSGKQNIEGEVYHKCLALMLFWRPINIHSNLAKGQLLGYIGHLLTVEIIRTLHIVVLIPLKGTIV